MKKLVAMILAMVMLAMPIASLAEGDFISEAVENGRCVERVTTFAMSETGEEDVDAIIGGLLKALSIVTYWQEADGVQTGLRINMDGTDILSIDVAGADEKLYLRSDLLKGDTIAVAQEDSKAIAEKVIKTLAAEGVIDEEDVNTALKQVEESISGTANPMADVDFEAIMNGFDFSALQQFAEGMAGRIEQSDLSGLPEGSDPAVAAVTMKLTAEDIIQCYDVIFDAVKNNKEYLALLDTMIVSVNDQPMSAEDAVNEMQKQLHDGLGEVVQGEIPVTIFMNGDDEVVAATMEMEMKVPDEESGEVQPIKADVDYWRHTEDGQVAHMVVYNILSDGELMANASLQLVTSDGYVDAMLNITDPENIVAFGFQRMENATDTERTVDAVVAISFGTNENGAANSASTVMVTIDIDAKKNGVDAEQTTVATLSLNGNDLASMTTQSKTGEPKESIVTEAAIRLAELGQEDFQAWLEGVINNLQVWVVTAIQSLPSDVLMMFIGR